MCIYVSLCVTSGLITVGLVCVLPFAIGLFPSVVEIGMHRMFVCVSDASSVVICPARILVADALFVLHCIHYIANRGH